MIFLAAGPSFIPASALSSPTWRGQVSASSPSTTHMSRNPRKNFSLSVNFLTLLDRFLNDPA
jgi:hypothetical protein